MGRVVVIRWSRRKILLQLAISAGFLWLWLGWMRTLVGDHWFWWVIFLGLALGVLSDLVGLFAPPTLRIDEIGFSERLLLRRREWRWENVSNFRLEGPGVKYVAFDDAAPPSGLIKLLNVKGWSGALGMGWSVPPARLMLLLEQHQALHSERSPMAPAAPDR